MILQLAGIGFIISDFLINRYLITNNSYMLYVSNEEDINRLYLVTLIISCIIFILSNIWSSSNERIIKL